jgi:hypothetical protein
MGKFYQDIPLPPLHEANYMFDDEPLELAIIDSFKCIYIYVHASWLLVDNEMKNIDVQ